MFNLFKSCGFSKDYFQILITTIYSLCDRDLEDPPEQELDDSDEKVEIVIIDDYI